MQLDDVMEWKRPSLWVDTTGHWYIPLEKRQCYRIFGDLSASKTNEQTIELSAIWDAMTITWRHCMHNKACDQWWNYLNAASVTVWGGPHTSTAAVLELGNA